MVILAATMARAQEPEVAVACIGVAIQRQVVLEPEALGIRETCPSLPSRVGRLLTDLGDPAWDVRARAAEGIFRLGLPGLREIERRSPIEDPEARAWITSIKERIEREVIRFGSRLERRSSEGVEEYLDRVVPLGYEWRLEGEAVRIAPVGCLPPSFDRRAVAAHYRGFLTSEREPLSTARQRWRSRLAGPPPEGAIQGHGPAWHLEFEFLGDLHNVAYRYTHAYRKRYILECYNVRYSLDSGGLSHFDALELLADLNDFRIDWRDDEIVLTLPSDPDPRDEEERLADALADWLVHVRAFHRRFGVAAPNGAPPPTGSLDELLDRTAVFDQKAWQLLAGPNPQPEMARISWIRKGEWWIAVVLD